MPELGQYGALMFTGERYSFLAGFLLFSSIFLSGQGKPWTEVRSPHFRVLTDGSERDARHVARAFEQMRAVFESQFPGFKLETPAPLTVLAARDEQTMKWLLPQMFKAGVGSQVGGRFQQGWERSFAVVRLDLMNADRRNPDTYALEYHEYIHSLLHANFRWLPIWLDEGLAEFYAYTRFEGDRMFIGAPPKSGRLNILDYRSPTPLRVFITTRSSMTKEESDTRLFYAQAWAVVHFLTFGPGMNGGEKLKGFFNSLIHGTDQLKAFEQAFGNADEVDKAYRKYINQLAFSTGILPAPGGVDEKDYAVRQLSLAETQAEIAVYQIEARQFELVRSLAEEAIKNDPKLGLGHQALGYALFNEGKEEDALKEFSQAVELDAKDYLALFAKTMTSPVARSETAEDQAAFKEALQKVVALNPRFAPAYIELAKLDLKRGDAAGALKSAKTAEGLEPFRSGYHVFMGEILLKTGHPMEASQEAAFVAERWGGSDRDEAMELWKRIPLEKRVSEILVDAPVPAEVQVAEGVVTSVTCKDRAYALTIESEGKASTFHATGFPVGFSDTLWVGRDHFTACFHLDGLRAVVKYKGNADKSYAGDMVRVGFRDHVFSGVKEVRD
jgi:tetratricopeptide (TPR) repeat protein